MTIIDGEDNAVVSNVVELLYEVVACLVYGYSSLVVVF